MGTITKENAKTKSDIAVLLFAHKTDSFHAFTALAEEMLLQYAKDQSKVRLLNPLTGKEREVDIAELLEMMKTMASRNSEMSDALKEIAKGEGRYDTSKLQHASNTIEDMKKLAEDALNQ